jgi:hypothetical protein
MSAGQLAQSQGRGWRRDMAGLAWAWRAGPAAYWRLSLPIWRASQSRLASVAINALALRVACEIHAINNLRVLTYLEGEL